MRHRATAPSPTTPSRLTRRALIDLAVVTAFVWIAVFVTHRLDLPDGLIEWNSSHPQWAIDEFALVSLFVAGALGVFSWRVKFRSRKLGCGSPIAAHSILPLPPVL